MPSTSNDQFTSFCSGRYMVWNIAETEEVGRAAVRSSALIGAEAECMENFEKLLATSVRQSPLGFVFAFERFDAAEYAGAPQKLREDGMFDYGASVFWSVGLFINGDLASGQTVPKGAMLSTKTPTESGGRIEADTPNNAIAAIIMKEFDLASDEHYPHTNIICRLDYRTGGGYKWIARKVRYKLPYSALLG